MPQRVLKVLTQPIRGGGLGRAWISRSTAALLFWATMSQVWAVRIISAPVCTSAALGGLTRAARISRARWVADGSAQTLCEVPRWLAAIANS